MNHQQGLVIISKRKDWLVYVIFVIFVNLHKFGYEKQVWNIALNHLNLVITNLYIENKHYYWLLLDWLDQVPVFMAENLITRPISLGLPPINGLMSRSRLNRYKIFRAYKFCYDNPIQIVLE